MSAATKHAAPTAATAMAAILLMSVCLIVRMTTSTTTTAACGGMDGTDRNPSSAIVLLPRESNDHHHRLQTPPSHHRTNTDRGEATSGITSLLSSALTSVTPTWPKVAPHHLRRQRQRATSGGELSVFFVHATVVTPLALIGSTAAFCWVEHAASGYEYMTSNATMTFDAANAFCESNFASLIPVLDKVSPSSPGGKFWWLGFRLSTRSTPPGVPYFLNGEVVPSNWATNVDSTAYNATTSCFTANAANFPAQTICTDDSVAYPLCRRARNTSVEWWPDASGKVLYAAITRPMTRPNAATFCTTLDAELAYIGNNALLQGPVFSALKQSTGMSWATSASAFFPTSWCNSATFLPGVGFWTGLSGGSYVSQSAYETLLGLSAPPKLPSTNTSAVDPALLYDGVTALQVASSNVVGDARGFLCSRRLVTISNSGALKGFRGTTVTTTFSSDRSLTSTDLDFQIYSDNAAMGIVLTQAATIAKSPGIAAASSSVALLAVGTFNVKMQRHGPYGYVVNDATVAVTVVEVPSISFSTTSVSLYPSQVQTITVTLNGLNGLTLPNTLDMVPKTHFAHACYRISRIQIPSGLGSSTFDVGYDPLEPGCTTLSTVTFDVSHPEFISGTLPTLTFTPVAKSSISVSGFSGRSTDFLFENGDSANYQLSIGANFPVVTVVTLSNVSYACQPFLTPGMAPVTFPAGAGSTTTRTFSFSTVANRLIRANITCELTFTHDQPFVVNPIATQTFTLVPGIVVEVDVPHAIGRSSVTATWALKIPYFPIGMSSVDVQWSSTSGVSSQLTIAEVTPNPCRFSPTNTLCTGTFTGPTSSSGGPFEGNTTWSIVSPPKWFKSIQPNATQPLTIIAEAKHGYRYPIASARPYYYSGVPFLFNLGVGSAVSEAIRARSNLSTDDATLCLLSRDACYDAASNSAVLPPAETQYFETGPASKFQRANLTFKVSPPATFAIGARDDGGSNVLTGGSTRTVYMSGRTDNLQMAWPASGRLESGGAASPVPVCFWLESYLVNGTVTITHSGSTQSCVAVSPASLSFVYNDATTEPVVQCFLLTGSAVCDYDGSKVVRFVQASSDAAFIDGTIFSTNFFYVVPVIDISVAAQTTPFIFAGRSTPALAWTLNVSYPVSTSVLASTQFQLAVQLKPYAATPTGSMSTASRTFTTSVRSWTPSATVAFATAPLLYALVTVSSNTNCTVKIPSNGLISTPVRASPILQVTTSNGPGDLRPTRIYLHETFDVTVKFVGGPNTVAAGGFISPSGLPAIGAQCNPSTTNAYSSSVTSVTFGCRFSSAAQGSTLLSGQSPTYRFTISNSTEFRSFDITYNPMLLPSLQPFWSLMSFPLGPRFFTDAGADRRGNLFFPVVPSGITADAQITIGAATNASGRLLAQPSSITPLLDGTVHAENRPVVMTTPAGPFNLPVAASIQTTFTGIGPAEAANCVLISSCTAPIATFIRDKFYAATTAIPKSMRTGINNVQFFHFFVASPPTHCTNSSVSYDVITSHPNLTATPATIVIPKATMRLPVLIKLNASSANQFTIRFVPTSFVYHELLPSYTIDVTATSAAYFQCDGLPIGTNAFEIYGEVDFVACNFSVVDNILTPAPDALDVAAWVGGASNATLITVTPGANFSFTNLTTLSKALNLSVTTAFDINNNTGVGPAVTPVVTSLSFDYQGTQRTFYDNVGSRTIRLYRKSTVTVSLPAVSKLLFSAALTTVDITVSKMPKPGRVLNVTFTFNASSSFIKASVPFLTWTSADSLLTKSIDINTTLASGSYVSFTVAESAEPYTGGSPALEFRPFTSTAIVFMVSNNVPVIVDRYPIDFDIIPEGAFDKYGYILSIDPSRIVVGANISIKNILTPATGVVTINVTQGFSWHKQFGNTTLPAKYVLRVDPATTLLSNATIRFNLTAPSQYGPTVPENNTVIVAPRIPLTVSLDPWAAFTGAPAGILTGRITVPPPNNTYYPSSPTANSLTLNATVWCPSTAGQATPNVTLLQFQRTARQLPFSLASTTGIATSTTTTTCNVTFSNALTPLLMYEYQTSLMQTFVIRTSAPRELSLVSSSLTGTPPSVYVGQPFALLVNSSLGLPEEHPMCPTGTSVNVSVTGVNTTSPVTWSRKVNAANNPPSQLFNATLTSHFFNVTGNQVITATPLTTAGNASDICYKYASKSMTVRVDAPHVMTLSFGSATAGYFIFLGDSAIMSLVIPTPSSAVPAKDPNVMYMNLTWRGVRGAVKLTSGHLPGEVPTPLLEEVAEGVGDAENVTWRLRFRKMNSGITQQTVKVNVTAVDTCDPVLAPFQCAMLDGAEFAYSGCTFNPPSTSLQVPRFERPALNSSIPTVNAVVTGPTTTGAAGFVTADVVQAFVGQNIDIGLYVNHSARMDLDVVINAVPSSALVLNVFGFTKFSPPNQGYYRSEFQFRCDRITMRPLWFTDLLSYEVPANPEVTLEFVRVSNGAKALDKLPSVRIICLPKAATLFPTPLPFTQMRPGSQNKRSIPIFLQSTPQFRSMTITFRQVGASEFVFSPATLTWDTGGDNSTQNVTVYYNSSTVLTTTFDAYFDATTDSPEFLDMRPIGLTIKPLGRVIVSGHQSPKYEGEAVVITFEVSDPPLQHNLSVNLTMTSPIPTNESFYLKDFINGDLKWYPEMPDSALRKNVEVYMVDVKDQPVERSYYYRYAVTSPEYLPTVTCTAAGNTGGVPITPQQLKDCDMIDVVKPPRVIVCTDPLCTAAEDGNVPKKHIIFVNDSYPMTIQTEECVRGARISARPYLPDFADVVDFTFSNPGPWDCDLLSNKTVPVQITVTGKGKPGNVIPPFIPPMPTTVASIMYVELFRTLLTATSSSTSSANVFLPVQFQVRVPSPIRITTSAANASNSLVLYFGRTASFAIEIQRPPAHGSVEVTAEVFLVSFDGTSERRSLAGSDQFRISNNARWMDDTDTVLRKTIDITEVSVQGFIASIAVQFTVNGSATAEFYLSKASFYGVTARPVPISAQFYFPGVAAYEDVVYRGNITVDALPEIGDADLEVNYEASVFGGESPAASGGPVVSWDGGSTASGKVIFKNTRLVLVQPVSFRIRRAAAVNFTFWVPADKASKYNLTVATNLNVKTFEPKMLVTANFSSSFRPSQYILSKNAQRFQLQLPRKPDRFEKVVVVPKLFFRNYAAGEDPTKPTSKYTLSESSPHIIVSFRDNNASKGTFSFDTSSKDSNEILVFADAIVDEQSGERPNKLMPTFPPIYTEIHLTFGSDTTPEYNTTIQFIRQLTFLDTHYVVAPSVPNATAYVGDSITVSCEISGLPSNGARYSIALQGPLDVIITPAKVTFFNDSERIQNFTVIATSAGSFRLAYSPDEEPTFDVTRSLMQSFLFNVNALFEPTLLLGEEPVSQVTLFVGNQNFKRYVIRVTEKPEAGGSISLIVRSPLTVSKAMALNTQEFTFPASGNFPASGSLQIEGLLESNSSSSSTGGALVPGSSAVDNSYLELVVVGEHYIKTPKRYPVTILPLYTFIVKDFPEEVFAGEQNAKYFTVSPSVNPEKDLYVTAQINCGDGTQAHVTPSSASWNRTSQPVQFQVMVNVSSTMTECNAFVQRDKQSLSTFADDALNRKVRTIPAPTLSILYYGTDRVQASSIAAADFRVRSVELRLNLKWTTFVDSSNLTVGSSNTSGIYISSDVPASVSPNGFSSMFTSAKLRYTWELNQGRTQILLTFAANPLFQPTKSEVLSIRMNSWAVINGTIPSGNGSVANITIDTLELQVETRTERVALEATTFSAAVISGLASMASATQAGRVLVIGSIADCPSTSWIELQSGGLPTFYTPYSIPLSADEPELLGAYTGAIIFNMLMTAFIIAVHYAACRMLHALRGKESNLDVVLATLRFPALSWFPIMLFYQTTITSVVRVLLYSSSPGYKVVASIGCLVTCVGVPAVCFKLYQKSHSLVYRAPLRRSTLNWLFERGAHSMPKDPLWMHRYGAPIMLLRGESRWYLLFEIGLLLCLGLVAGVHPDNSGGCVARACTAAILFVVQLVLVSLVQPYSTKFDNFFYMLGYALQVSAMGVTLYGTFVKAQFSYAFAISGRILFAFSVMLVIKAVIDWFRFIKQGLASCAVLDPTVDRSFNAETNENQRLRGKQHDASQAEKALLTLQTGFLGDADSSSLERDGELSSPRRLAPDGTRQKAAPPMTIRSYPDATLSVSSVDARGRPVTLTGYHRLFDPSMQQVEEAYQQSTYGDDHRVGNGGARADVDDDPWAQYDGDRSTGGNYRSAVYASPATRRRDVAPAVDDLNWNDI